MMPNTNTPYNPAAHSTPTTLLPEEVFGYIDVVTLADIHRYLRESEAQDDIDLAAWIQENYLYGVEKDQPTATIRTAQGFAQLDRAYRRVRSLTNKAQDKWPFFDRNFKEMSSATVRNNARGEAAPGVLYPIEKTHKALTAVEQLGASTVSNTSSAPGLQVPFVSVKPSRHQLCRQEEARPAQQNPVLPPSNLPATPAQQQAGEKDSVHSQNLAQEISMCMDTITDASSREMIQPELPQPAATSIRRTRDAADDVKLETPSTSPSSHSKLNDNDSKADPIRDAGGGKVRGPNGRYLSKDDDLSSLKKIKKPKGKGGRPSLKSSDQNHLMTMDGSSDKPDELSTGDEDVSVEVQTPSTPPPDQKIEEQNKSNAAATIAVLDTTSPLAAKDGTENQATSLAASTPAYLLAAEADPVPSNLDRLPPNSRRAIKRKSEPVVQEGERKRGRYGGIVGRPRKSEQRENRQGAEENDLTQDHGENGTDSLPQMTTRRSARQSAAAHLDTPKADEPTSEHDKKDSKLLKKGVTAETSPSNESMTTAEDKTMGGMEEKDTATIHKNTSTPARKPKKKGTRSSAEPSTRKRSAKTPKPDLLKMGLEKTTPVPVKKSSTDIEKNGTTPTSSDSTGVIMFNGTKETHTGYLELFARLTTGQGIIEIPIPTDQLNSDEAKMIEKYAEWNAQPDAVPVPYGQFRQIFSFAKKD
ncbi:hypothetical protein COCHEDRAFT_1145172 [Bipolaris maydis C5]|uniref:Uncharacterized protein n=2 Tax=Cochliobolus heterostrophus TaxID=5016 RepID=M2SQA1_COCH5|nr:hypothetical protein COCHEDRAFT_1145172 [Bipolaris maydis C5]KAJ5023239.1 hypothetical protein J3E73DRAFT_384613 [Bipolaris maydis]KAJ5056011.1 hypothetical protein J3E74DRAFT_421802 [Bipolaris maydis]KAJ6193763.1 hypothetical protein J3E72DRAFT_388512 [Bipolaris maydis]KAJ6212116.1 hypothetical protein PSV09DRAFT_1145172 [Bipolaris maydis]